MRVLQRGLGLSQSQFGAWSPKEWKAVRKEDWKTGSRKQLRWGKNQHKKGVEKTINKQAKQLRVWQGTGIALVICANSDLWPRSLWRIKTKPCKKSRINARVPRESQKRSLKGQTAGRRKHVGKEIKIDTWKKRHLLDKYLNIMKKYYSLNIINSKKWGSSGKKNMSKSTEEQLCEWMNEKWWFQLIHFCTQGWRG